MSQQQNEGRGPILWLSQQSLPIRFTAFLLFVIIILGLIVAITAGLYYFNVSNYPRQIPFALSESVSLAEFVQFDDEDAYPAAVASAADGTLYTGSYLNGAVWRVDGAGVPVELPDTREQIGSVIGLDVGTDGTLYILDHLAAFSTGGARVWQADASSLQQVAEFGTAGDVIVSKPNDIAVDASGRLYLLDIALGQILRIEGETTEIWWAAPDEMYQIAGLAYDAANDALIISDAGRSAIYRIAVTATDTEAARETLYIDESLVNEPRFNGITAGADGRLYVAAFDLNEIWEIAPDSNTFTILANNYRGSSDVAYDPANNRLYVNNWDQSWLVPITFVLFQVDVPPRLPFSVDVIRLQ